MNEVNNLSDIVANKNEEVIMKGKTIDKLESIIK
jgi:hypothetical protein